MKRLVVLPLLTIIMVTSGLAQSFDAFVGKFPRLAHLNETKLEKETDATRVLIDATDASQFLGETVDQQYAIGRINFSKGVILIYFTKPVGAPLGKLTAATFSSNGKRISTEAIGVFADYEGMHFRTTLNSSAQAKGAIAITTNVEALKDNGEVNYDMSRISTYYVSSKGKITRM